MPPVGAFAQGGGFGGVGRAKRARLRSRAGMHVSGCAVKIIVA